MRSPDPTLVDEIGQRAWLALLAEQQAARDLRGMLALLRQRLAEFRHHPLGSYPRLRAEARSRSPLPSDPGSPYRGDANRLVERLRHADGLGVKAESFEPWIYRR